MMMVQADDDEWWTITAEDDHGWWWWVTTMMTVVLMCMYACMSVFKNKEHVTFADVCKLTFVFAKPDDCRGYILRMHVCKQVCTCIMYAMYAMDSYLCACKHVCMCMYACDDVCMYLSMCVCNSCVCGLCVPLSNVCMHVILLSVYSMRRSSSTIQWDHQTLPYTWSRSQCKNFNLIAYNCNSIHRELCEISEYKIWLSSQYHYASSI